MKNVLFCFEKVLHVRLDFLQFQIVIVVVMKDIPNMIMNMLAVNRSANAEKIVQVI